MTCIGVDKDPAQVAKATDNMTTAGVESRVHLILGDVTGQYTSISVLLLKYG